MNTFKRNHLFKYLYFKLFKPTLKFSEEDITPFQLHRKDEAIFLKYKTHEFEERINKEFNYWAETVEAEYLIHYNKKCIIEPYCGWVLNERNQVIRRSLPYMISDITPFPDYIFYKRKKYIYLKEAVSIRYNWLNYWHFFNDVVGQLYLLEKLDFDKNIPLLVPKKALEAGYVKEFFKTDYSKKWKWIFQERDEYVKLNEVFLCKSISNIKEQFIYGGRIFNPKFIHVRERKIFINRSKSRGRCISNIEEIILFVQNFGFEIIDCDTLSVEEQNEIFSSTVVIIGIHGAGLTNMFFRYPLKCRVIEIFPPGHYPTHYYWLAKEFNFDYSAISGENLIGNEFSLELNKLENIIK